VIDARVCWSCLYCVIDPGCPGYSEYTPSSPMTIECTKRHWTTDDVDSREGLRLALMKAETCTDFKAAL
jgi:hypothetical protein